MKTRKVWVGYSMLQDKYGRVYAEYLKKFLDAYEGKGLTMWGITTGTNAVSGFHGYPSSSMGWLPERQVGQMCTNKYNVYFCGPVYMFFES